MLGKKSRYLARHKSATPSPRTSPWTRGIAVIATAVSALLVAGSLTAAPALAAPQAINAGLTIAKVVNNSKAVDVKPGGEFTYKVTIGCDEQDCINASFTDALPAELAGFDFVGISNPPGVNVTFTPEGKKVGANSVLHGVFTNKLPGTTNVGLPVDKSIDITLTLRAPADLPASWASNGVPIVNTATVSADNAATETDTASVTVKVDKKTGVNTTKSWEPKSQQFKPGDTSTITLGVGNTGNINATELDIQDPKSAVEGATALGADNPFSIVNFTGFGPVTLAEGATRVAVDAYVYNKTTLKWEWITGEPTDAAGITLPASVSNEDVGGLRIRQLGTDDSIVYGGKAGSFPLTVEQRSTKRGGSPEQGLASGAKVTNIAEGTATYPELPPVSTTATADFAVGALTVAVTATKTIEPKEIPAGGRASAEITAKNTSNGPVNSITLSDRDYFSDTLTFGGFAAAGLAYPAGATAGSITWVLATGETQTVSFGSGESPVAPAGITGFDITYTGSIPQDTIASVDFVIAPTFDHVEKGKAVEKTKNTLNTSATNAVGTATATDTKPLDIYFPSIDMTLKKDIRPGGAVEPGGLVVAQLQGTTSTESKYVNPTSIVITDEWDPKDPATNFWDAFNPVSIASTQVIAGSTLLVEYKVDGKWIVLDSLTAVGKAEFFRADLPTGVDITGLRYTFSNEAGLGQGTTVRPNATFEAREKLRSDDTKLTAVPAAKPQPTEYKNHATAQAAAKGPTPESSVTSDVKEAVAPAKIQITEYPGGTGPRPLASKDWYDANNGKKLGDLNSQSGDRAVTRLGWGVTNTGFDKIVISDPNGKESTPKDTVFQAFDLIAVQPVSYNSDPLLHWDTVSAVELYNSDLGAWVTVTAPATGWMNNTGFSGHTLTAEERASTTGMRLTVVPNTTARTAADNAMAPPVNSGIATSTSGSVRTIPLLWELRNTLRVPSGDSKWVEAETTLNADKGSVENTVLVTGTRGDKTSSNTDKDIISLTNSTPAVKVSKVADKKINVLPNLTDATPADFPVVTYTMKAANTAGASASYLRLTDPNPCAKAADCVTDADKWNTDVFAGAAYNTSNPFERLTLTGITFPDAAQMADRDASQVLLWDRAEDGTLSTRAPLSITAAEALTPAQLATVVGASVLFQGTNPEKDGGKLKAGNLAADQVAESNVLGMNLVTQVRAYERTSGAVVTPDSIAKSDIGNQVQAQSYDPVLEPTLTPSDLANESVKVVSGELKIATTKTISPSSLTEVQRHTPLTLTLAANDNNSTVSTGKVVVEDSTEEFWNTYRLTGFNPAQVTLPAGADRVQVDLRTGTAQDATWHNGTAAAAAALPAGVELDAVTGIRFTFTKLNAVAFSRTTPPASWNTNIVLPLALRDVTLAGEEIVFAGSIDNVITAETSRNDNPLIYPSKDAKNEASISLGLGTHSLDVSKAPAQQTVQVDADNLWTLTFTNSRNSYLNITELVDIMPATLKWDEEDPTFSTSEGGTLSTDVSTRLDRETNTLHFTWPEGANRMAPGEKFTVTMNMPLQPGLEPNGKAINQMVVTTAQQLDSCTNTSVPSEGKIPNLPGNQCGTTNYVQQSTGGLFQLYKTVKGELRENAEDKLVSGATNKIPGRDCVADADGFFGPECAANTVVGGTDAWRLRIANTGDQAISSATIVDVLPATGDRTLVAGTSRESTFRPLFDGAHGVQLLGNLAGAKMTWQVTTGTSVCTGPNSGSTWRANPTCEASTWIDSDKFNLAEESDSITAIRVKYDFSGMTGGGLAPNASASVDFQTINVPRSDAFSDGAPVVAPVDGVVAWNQAGALANFVNNESLTRAPKVVGVRIQTGALAIAKQMVGEAAELYAPGFAGAAVQCRVPSGLLAEDGTPAFAKLTMPGNGSYGLNTENEFARTITGLPLGALCDVTEAGERGLYGETRRGGGAQNVKVVNSDLTDLAPIVLENTYDFSNLKIAKQVDSLAQGVNFGTFSFSLQCTAAVSGVPVLWDGEDRLDFTLVDGEEKIVDRIPAGASCELTETDNSLANDTRMVVNGVDVHAPQLMAAEEEGSEEPETAAPVSATFTTNPVSDEDQDAPANTVVVHNVYATGTLSVFKNVAGSGADVFGNGPFTAAITCTYGDQELYANGSFAITGGESTLVTSEEEPEGVQFPYGTVCGVTEVKTGGANHTENPDAITIGEAASTVDITNYFEVGSLELIKERTGSGVEKFGNDDYTAAVTCTWQRDGETMTVALPNSGVVVLSASQDYRATIEGILVGAECAVTETDAGLAVATAYSPEDGIVTILDPETEQEPAQVIITNTFLTGSLEITKTVASPMASLGEPVNYTILVRNTGEIEAKNVPVTDTLPAGATLVSAPGATAANGVLTWTIDALEPGAEKSFSVTVTYAAAGEMVNCASLTTPVGPWDKTTVKNPGTDPESSCATVQILPLPALAGGLPSTGGTFLQLGGLALALMLAGLLIARRNRREELGSNA